MTTETDLKKWYVVRAVSGQENKIKSYIESDITRLGLSDFVEEVLVPTEKVIQIRNGKKINKERNYFPGYICLLYTSPSPRDGLLSRMPSSA